MPPDLSSILDKLLWQNGAKLQLTGAILGAFTGLLLLLSGAQFYFDLQHLLYGQQRSNEHFIQLNKKVNIFNTIGGASGFSAAEMEDLRALSTVEEAGVFSSNNFKAGAYSDMLGFYTELFFESVPDAFLDVDEPAFRWYEGKEEIPVLVARDYLALYNFGFAPSQGLPQISAKSARRLVMDIRLEGNGRRETFKGRVVGFTDRINSILVPSDFMQWANGRFGDGRSTSPAKIILKVKNPLDKALSDHMEEEGYEVSTGRVVGEEYLVILNTVISVIAMLGVLILLLATLVFIMGFQLILSRNASSVRLLLEQGYTPVFISKQLEKKFLSIFLMVIAAVSVSLFAIRFLFIRKMETQGFDIPLNLHWLVYLLAIIMVALLIWRNLTSIRNGVDRLGTA